jgi:hypothetical protein
MTLSLRHTREDGYPKRDNKNAFMKKWIFDK